MEDIILLDNYKVTIDGNSDAHVIGELDGETIEIGVIKDALTFTGTELNNRALLVLKGEGFGIKPKEEPKPKRKYTRHVRLGLASEYGKVTLKLAEPSMPEHECYVLYLKGTRKFVWKYDDRGIYVADDKGGLAKTKPLLFTKADIKLISNVNEFDLVKKMVKAKWVKNKIAPKDNGVA